MMVEDENKTLSERIEFISLNPEVLSDPSFKPTIDLINLLIMTKTNSKNHLATSIDETESICWFDNNNRENFNIMLKNLVSGGNISSVKTTQVTFSIPEGTSIMVNELDIDMLGIENPCSN